MAERLSRLLTDLGERSTEDAVGQCSRCGYCEQVCPTYAATGRESFSPRGRNQIVRLMLEGKLKDPEASADALAGCLLCGACQTACYAHVPTPDLVLEGRRLLTERPNSFVKFLCYLLVQKPSFLESFLKVAYFFKRLGLSRLAARSGLLSLLGLKGLAEAELHVDQVPGKFLSEELEGMPQAENPAWLYFAACGPNYLFPSVGMATVKVLAVLKGPGRFLKTGCCGLLPHNYGELGDARTLARRIIERAEAVPGVPVVADCSSCAAFLKGYEQLFLTEPEMRERAGKFSDRIKDIVEILEGNEGRFASLTESMPGSTTYHESCRACHGQGVRAPEKMLRRIFGKGYRSLPESDVCCGGAGAYAFTQPELSDQVLRRKAGAIAAIQARTVATSGTSCLIQLAQGLRKYYPDARVVHLSELAAAALPPDPL